MITPPTVTVDSASANGTTGNSSSTRAQYLVRSRSWTIRAVRSCCSVRSVPRQLRAQESNSTVSLSHRRRRCRRCRRLTAALEPPRERCRALRVQLHRVHAALTLVHRLHRRRPSGTEGFLPPATLSIKIVDGSPNASEWIPPSSRPAAQLGDLEGPHLSHPQMSDMIPCLNRCERMTASHAAPSARPTGAWTSSRSTRVNNIIGPRHRVTRAREAIASPRVVRCCAHPCDRAGLAGGFARPTRVSRAGRSLAALSTTGVRLRACSEDCLPLGSKQASQAA
jgi:hypothetical protein